MKKSFRKSTEGSNLLILNSNNTQVSQVSEYQKHWGLAIFIESFLLGWIIQ